MLYLASPLPPPLLSPPSPASSPHESHVQPHRGMGVATFAGGGLVVCQALPAHGPLPGCLPAGCLQQAADAQGALRVRWEGPPCPCVMMTYLSTQMLGGVFLPATGALPDCASVAVLTDAGCCGSEHGWLPGNEGCYVW